MEQHQDGAIDLAHMVAVTAKNVPKPAITQFVRCLTVVAEAMSDLDADMRLRGDVLAMLLPRLLLTPFRSDWWSSRSVREFKRRCAHFAEGDWRTLYRDSAAFAANPCDEGEAAAKAEMLRQRRAQEEDEGRQQEERIHGRGSGALCLCEN